MLSLFCLLLSLCLLSSACGADETARLHGPADKGYIPTVAQPIAVDGLSADGYFVYDCKAEHFVAIGGADRLIYPASVTKLLTALYALTLLSPDAVIAPGGELELVAEGSSVAYVKSHHRLTVELLIAGMMIPSGNDAAYVLAAAGGRALDSSLDGKAAVERFVEGMNGYATEIGLCSSHFTVPDGYGGREHYSSVEDMAIVCRLAFANELIARYAAMAETDVTYDSGHTNHWENTNLLLLPESDWYDSRVIAGKTGSLDGCYNVVFAAEDDGGSYLIGIFGSNTKTARFADSVAAMNAVMGNHTEYRKGQGTPAE